MRFVYAIEVPSAAVACGANWSACSSIMPEIDCDFELHNGRPNPKVSIVADPEAHKSDVEN